jgi:hypothetical protein
LCCYGNGNDNGIQLQITQEAVVVTVVVAKEVSVFIRVYPWQKAVTWRSWQNASLCAGDGQVRLLQGIRDRRVNQVER